MIGQLIFYSTSLLFIYVLVRNSKPFGNAISAVAQHVQIKAFPGNLDFDLAKFSVLRVVFGIILISRAISILTNLANDDFSSNIGFLSILYLLSTLFLTIGLFTQYVILFLVFFMWQIGDQILGTSTLGNDIAAMLAVLLFLTSSGKRLSVDSIIVSSLPRATKWLLYPVGDVNSEIVALAKLAAFTSYSAVCMYSLSMHINESAWMTGVAGPLLLTNNFMSFWHVHFEQLFISSEFAVYVAKFLLWIMMFWYVALLPFVLLGGFFRKFVIIWGLLFFSLCLVVLNLGSLAEIEFVLWAALFFTHPSKSKKGRLTIFYDDKCNLCDKTIRLICFLDVFSKARLKPVSENQELLINLQIDPKDALADLYGIDEDTNEVRAGYDFYLLLSKKLILLWAIYPLLYFGKVLGIGKAIYRNIASRRNEYFGVCTIPSGKISYKTCVLVHKEYFFQKSIPVHIVVLAICYLLSIPSPSIGISGSNNVASRTAHFYGIAPIDVFNRTDLRMAENWFTIRALNLNELVPIFTSNGERLGMHDSDRVYFGHTLKFRREVIGESGCFFEAKKDLLVYLTNVYLRKINAVKGKYEFEYIQYNQNLPDNELLKVQNYKKNEVRERCRLIYSINHET